jgi:hypothetical protein
LVPPAQARPKPSAIKIARWKFASSELDKPLRLQDCF